MTTLMIDAEAETQTQYNRGGIDALPEAAGFYQATIRIEDVVGPSQRPMARIGLDLKGRWFEFHRGTLRLLDPSDIVLYTMRAVDWPNDFDLVGHKLFK